MRGKITVTFDIDLDKVMAKLKQTGEVDAQLIEEFEHSEENQQQILRDTMHDTINQIRDFIYGGEEVEMRDKEMGIVFDSNMEIVSTGLISVDKKGGKK